MRCSAHKSVEKTIRPVQNASLLESGRRYTAPLTVRNLLKKIQTTSIRSHRNHKISKTVCSAGNPARNPSTFVAQVEVLKPVVTKKPEVVFAENYSIPTGELSEVMRPLDGVYGPEHLELTTYLKKILTSKVYDVAVETPLEIAPRLSERIGNTLLLKREDLQPVFSFKLRGAYNCMAALSRAQLAKGVVTASAGNHAQGVAMSAGKLGCSAVVAMPKATPSIKVDNVRRLGATVELVGDTFDATQAWALEHASSTGRTFIPPFDHPDTIAGQGTIGMEIFNSTDTDEIHAVFVPVGGGGLIAGIAAYIKALKPEIRIVGVEPSGANAMAYSLYMGKRIQLDQVDTFADGVAVKTTGVECFRLCQDLVDGVVLVDTDQICGAIKDVFEDTRSILEPAGALAVAGAKAYLARYGLKGTTCVAITSGANMNFGKLRVVSELADLGQRQEALLASFIPETQGSFKKFYSTIGSSFNITEFKYRLSDSDFAKVLFSISVKNMREISDLQARLNAHGMRTMDLSDNELAKEHLRHLVGGHACVLEERLLQFQFPEQAGALETFLEAIATRWNITLFHYRNSGERVAKVLVGLQIPDSELGDFQEAAELLKPQGFSYIDESSDKAFKNFMC